MAKNTLMNCPHCGKELPVSRKGKLPRHYEADRPYLLCRASGRILQREAVAA